MAFKELYVTENPQLKNAYIFNKHGSDSASVVLSLLNIQSELARDEEVIRKLSVLLSIMEPLLINDQNLEKAMEDHALTIFLNILTNTPINEKPSSLLKFIIRCLTSCLRSEVAIPRAVANPEFLQKMVQVLRSVEDEEIVANVCKMIRICLRDDSNMEVIVKHWKDVGNILIETLKQHAYSDAISMEVLSGLRNLTRRSEFVILIALSNMQVIMQVAQEKKIEKVKTAAVQVLKNCSKVKDYEDFIIKNSETTLE